MLLWTLYYQEVQNFLKSLTITNKGMAATYETQTLTRFGADTLYPQANPYYARLCGNYTDQDEMIYVVSLDTGATIPFTKETLAAHARTKAYYHFTGNGYPILCRTYPEKVDLIKAIVCPVQVKSELWNIESEEYLHFCGEYVLDEEGEYSENDPVMTIVHPQTGGTVEFTKATLDAAYLDDDNVSHTLREIYRLPSQAYFDLLTRYPTRADLIHGIINPMSPVDQLVSEDNLTLVSYDLTVLQTREAQSILDAVQRALLYLRNRWYVSEYQYEEYYNTAFWALLWYTMHLTVYAQRMKNLRTPQVHPLHMWEYLGSFGLNEEYNEGLTEEQAWFLYKNLAYLMKHKGTQGALLKLVNGLLTSLNTTLKTKHLLLNATSYPTTVKAIPELLSRNFGAVTTPMEDYVHGVETIADTIKREHELGLEPSDDEEIIAKQTQQLQRAPVTWLPTKLIEVQKIDRNDNETYPYYEFALHSAIYWWNAGLLTGSVSVSLASMDVVQTFTYGEILAILHYLTGGTISGTTYTPPTLIPTVFNLRAVLKRPAPSSMTDVINIDGLGELPITEILDVPALLDAIPNVTRDTSVPMVLDTPEDLIARLDEHYTALYSWFIQIRDSADAPFHIAMNRFMFNVLDVGALSGVELVDGYTTYAQWMAGAPAINGVIVEYGATEEKRATLLAALLDAAFPVDKSQYAGGYSMSLKQYVLMRSLFTRLCSYNVAFLNTEIRDISHITLKPITVLNYDSILSIESVVDMTQYQFLDDWPTS